MSERERLYRLLEQIPDSKIPYIIGYVQGLAVEDKKAHTGGLSVPGGCGEPERTGSESSLDGLRMDLFKR